MNKQKTLLRIVKTWDLNPKPEYRGFRCANCQNYMKKAWHHWLLEGGYKTPVHFCNKCEKDFKAEKTKTAKPILRVNKSKFTRPNAKLKAVINKLNVKSKSIYKTFVCDNCGRNLHKAYHIWNILKKDLVETHLCKQCGNKILIK
jgi:DNA replicative helicase MCM subunit Mcm2 (Cdc46/Mcm family)